MTKQLSPMQQLLEKLKYAKEILEKELRVKKHKVDVFYDIGYSECLKSIINDIELQMLPIEKQCISDSFGDGFGDKFKLLSGEQYYNEKFVEQKEDTTAHLCDKHGQLDDAGAYAEDDKD